MKRITFVLALFFICVKIFPQGVYTYDITKDIAIGALAIGFSITPFFIPDSRSGTVTDQRDGINFIDSGFMFSYNKPMDILSDIGLYGLMLLPVISLAGNITDLNAVASYSIMYAEAILLTYGTLEIIKVSTNRNRPYTYFNGIPAGKENDYFKSFASRHTAMAFMSAGFLSSTFYSEYPESKWRLPIIIGSHVLAAGIASMRIVSGNHFMTDVLAGAAIGSVYGLMIPLLHKNKNAMNNIAIDFIGNGFMVSIKV